jgi:hypothetical protein
MSLSFNKTVDNREVGFKPGKMLRFGYYQIKSISDHTQEVKRLQMFENIHGEHMLLS